MATVSVPAVATDYTWDNSVASGNWSDAANWGGSGYPGQNANDTATFTGEAAVKVTLTEDITVVNLTFNKTSDKLITIDLNGNNINCSGTLMLVAATEADHNSNVTLKGSGTVKTSIFDFPSSYVHSFTIQDTTTILEITTTLWGDSEGLLKFSGNGYLYMPNGGANVNSNPANINYTALDESHRLPYSGGSQTYSCTISTLPDFSNEINAEITFTGGNNKVRIPFTVSITGSATFTLNDNQISTGTYYGNKYTTYNSDGTVSNSTISEGNSNIVLNQSSYTLKCTSGKITTEGDGITIIFYSPDGYAPDESFMELGRITWYYKHPTWTGSGDNQLWTNTDNWSYAGISNFDPSSMSDYDITISETNSAKCPIISEDESISVKSLTITTDSQVTQTGGKLTTNSISTGTATGKFIQTGGILELATTGSTEPSISGYSNYITVKNLSVGENATLSLPFVLSLSNLILNSGSSITDGSYSLTTQNLIITAGSGSISLPGTYSANNLIIYSGSVNFTGDATAQNDIIIVGSGYSSSSFKYNHYVSRPSRWTSTSLSLSDFAILPDGTEILETSFSGSLTLGSGTKLTAGASGQGNFYINGATLTGVGSNQIIIPQNDTPENFCAEAVNSTISGCTVVCADDNSTDGSKAQIPATGCTLSNCANFDDTEFEISQAYTVSDSRIYIEFSEPVRYTNSELSNSELLKSINIGTSEAVYGYATAIYNSKTGTTNPGDNPENLYLVSSTTWNTDATGTSIGSGMYTDSNGNFKRVKPSLFIPQCSIDTDGNITCGYIITNKWGKRLKDYTFDPSDFSDRSFSDVADGIPEAEKTKRVPPSFAAVLTAVGSNKISITFSKPIVTESSKIAYYTADYTSDGTPYNVQRVTISQSMSGLFPYCFEIFSIDSAGNPINSDLQINKNVSAQIDEISTGFSIITMQLNRTVTLPDIQKLYVRLVAPTDGGGNLLYPATKYDAVTGQEGVTVSFIQESDAEHTEEGINCMILKTAHALSDFALDAVKPSYAYISNMDTNQDSDTDFFKSIYGTDSAAVHDFSKSQKNYGTLPYGYEISIVSKVLTGSETPAESDYPPSLRLFVTDSADSASLFPTLKSHFNKDVSTWLPNSNDFSLDNFNAYTDALNSHFWDNQSTLISQTPANGFLSIISKDTVIKMTAGSQINFLYALCDSQGVYIPHYKTPYCNYASDTYDLSKTQSSPLFAFTLSNSSDLFSLSPWFITLKSITEQRGGVTILNNVINPTTGEKTVLKVNMPSSGKLDVMVMTLDGNIVKYLAHGTASAGEHFYYWDGKNNSGSAVARGMYFVIVKAPGIDENRKVMVVK